MKHYAKNWLLAVTAAMVCSAMSAQDIKVDYKAYPDANPFPKVEKNYSNTVGEVREFGSQNVRKGSARSSRYGDKRPDHINNALTKYYPSVFNQSGGSCGSAQAVGYTMTLEMNAYRDADASYEENQLPTHFTWLHTYCGIGKYEIMNRHGVPNVPTYGGRTYSNTFGLQDTSNPDYGWMQGYDKWYSAMFNRTLGGDIFCDRDQTTEEGREQLKQYLWNHWGDESFMCGGVSGIGVASGGDWQHIPNTPTNRAIGVANMYYVASWGQTYDHALTVVGYDDRIEFDLDGNGVCGEVDKDEVGAWIICNSWGAGWCNQGFIYCPYKYSYAMGTDQLPMNSGHYTWRKDYEPKRVLKIVMDYSRRSEISISAGINPDTTATEPQKTEVMPFFDYAGNGQKDETDKNNLPEPEVPMLGRWKGRMNYEPMEFGYDVTDLSSAFDLTKPVKYFLKINSKQKAVGTGTVYRLSLMDYTYDPEGLEIPTKVDTVAILNGGKTTLLSLTALGQQIYSPLNVALNGKRLTWSEPMSSSFEITRYYIYKGNDKIAEVPSMSHSYIVDDENATYYVATAYSYRNRRLVSAPSLPGRNQGQIINEENNQVLQLSDASATVSGLLTEGMKQGTIEFWLKPTTVKSFNQQMGEGWGSLFFCITATGQIQCGWDTNDRIITKANTVKAGNWNHIAIVADGNQMTLYVDGMKKGNIVSESYSGIPALSTFFLRNFDAHIDELRIWRTARSMADIYRNKSLAIANPTAQSDLVAYYPMTIIERDGQRYIKDCASSYDMALSDGETNTDDSILKGAITTYAATFNVPQGTLYAGEPLRFNSTAMVNTIDWQWSAPDAITPTASNSAPYFTFEKPGTYQVTHTATCIDGTTAEATQEITVVSPEAPVADFSIANTEQAAGDLFSLANQSSGSNCTFTWSTPGADQEEMHSVNAGVTYSRSGVFPITLTARNSGGESSKTLYVTVAPSAPRVAFTVNPPSIMLGETTYLIDDTKQNPDNWKWTVSNNIHSYEVNGQYSSLTPTHPGYYDITLETSNSIGTSATTEQGLLMVLNADSKNGLNMSGNERLESTRNLFADGTKAFTIEWWMLPYVCDGALNMTTENEMVTIATDHDGNMSVSVGGKTAKSGNGYVVPGTWHHYAVSFTFGSVKFYRDGVLVASPSTRIGTSTTDWGKLILSGGEDGYKGQIDELRIWSKALSLSTMKGLINAPLTNIENLVETNGLVAYYDFNQNGGSVKDRTSNAIDLSRIGFGPDGDAWGLSTGVFTLDLDADSPTEVIEADGITHVYQAIREGKTTNIEGTLGGIRFAFEKGEQVTVYTLEGQRVFCDTVEGVHTIAFPAGIYIANGKKIIVR